MKTILFLISIFFSIQVLGQTDSLPKFDTIETLCEKGEKLAIQLADSGIYQIYSFGYPIMSPKDWDYNSFYSHYLKEKYNVDYSHRGCVVFTNEKCYSKNLIFLFKPSNLVLFTGDPSNNLSNTSSVISSQFRLDILSISSFGVMSNGAPKSTSQS